MPGSGTKAYTHAQANPIKEQPHHSSISKGTRHTHHSRRNAGKVYMQVQGGMCVFGNAARQGVTMQGR